MLKYRVSLVVAFFIACRSHDASDGAWALGASSIPGAPEHVDPLAVVALARARVQARPNVMGEPALASILMNGVGPDGAMDLARCAGSIRYEFRAKTRSGEWLATATVVAKGMYTPILSDGPPDAVSAPKCTVARVWNAARAAGAKDDPCATMEYRRGWSFRGGGIEATIDDATCSVVPSSRDARAAMDREVDALDDKLVENAAARPRTRELEDERAALEQRLQAARDRRNAMSAK